MSPRWLKFRAIPIVLVIHQCSRISYYHFHIIKTTQGVQRDSGDKPNSSWYLSLSELELQAIPSKIVKKIKHLWRREQDFTLTHFTPKSALRVVGAVGVDPSLTALKNSSSDWTNPIRRIPYLNYPLFIRNSSRMHTSGKMHSMAGTRIYDRWSLWCFYFCNYEPPFPFTSLAVAHRRTWSIQIFNSAKCKLELRKSLY